MSVAWSEEDGSGQPFGGPSVLEFHGKMYRTSKILVYAHSVITTFGAISYTIVSILITAGSWFPMLAAFTVNMTLMITLAVAVNLSLCLAAVLLVGFKKCRLLFVKIWFWGQLFIEMIVTVVLIIAVVLNCRIAAILSIPAFLYFVVSLSAYRQISASVSYQNNYCLK